MRPDRLRPIGLLEVTADRIADSIAELIEVVCLAGFYHLVAFACGAFDVAPEAWAVRPPVAV